MSASVDCPVDTSRFVDTALGNRIRSLVSTPTFVYSHAMLSAQAANALAFPNAYGLTVRFAMKASPNAAILKIFHSLGMHFDASSGYEVHRALRAGIPADYISLSSQELPRDIKTLHELGCRFNACSLSQLESFGKQCPGSSLGLRFNPGEGSGGTGKTNVGGLTSSFGIWHELIPQVQAIVAAYNLKVVKIHTHIGSGSDPKIWERVSHVSLDICRHFPDVRTLNLGGGFKVGRMAYEISTDLPTVGKVVKAAFEGFAEEDEQRRQLHLEIEPGTFLTANSGCLLCEVRDIVYTGRDGYTFMKLDSGMTEILRPSLYGAQHPISVLIESHQGQDEGDGKDEGKDWDEVDYVVVGHCCESGDLFTSAPGQPEVLLPRRMKRAQIGSLVIIDATGAYCASMNTKNYNSFPEAPEVLVGADGDIRVIRNRQTLEQMLQNEV